VGKPGDNAWSESFFSVLKKESVHWAGDKTYEEWRLLIFSYIEGFYNTVRVQKGLGYRSPKQFLKDWENDLALNIA
jgi:putative transposase